MRYGAGDVRATPLDRVVGLGSSYELHDVRVQQQY